MTPELERQVLLAITQLAQEVHALNPGIRYDFDLGMISRCAGLDLRMPSDGGEDGR